MHRSIWKIHRISQTKDRRIQHYKDKKNQNYSALSNECFNFSINNIVSHSSCYSISSFYMPKIIQPVNFGSKISNDSSLILKDRKLYQSRVLTNLSNRKTSRNSLQGKSINIGEDKNSKRDKIDNLSFVSTPKLEEVKLKEQDIQEPIDAENCILIQSSNAMVLAKPKIYISDPECDKNEFIQKIDPNDMTLDLTYQCDESDILKPFANNKTNLGRTIEFFSVGSGTECFDPIKVATLGNDLTEEIYELSNSMDFPDIYFGFDDDKITDIVTMQKRVDNVDTTKYALKYPDLYAFMQSFVTHLKIKETNNMIANIEIAVGDLSKDVIFIKNKLNEILPTINESQFPSSPHKLARDGTFIDDLLDYNDTTINDGQTIEDKDEIKMITFPKHETLLFCQSAGKEHGGTVIKYKSLNMVSDIGVKENSNNKNKYDDNCYGNDERRKFNIFNIPKHKKLQRNSRSTSVKEFYNSFQEKAIIEKMNVHLVTMEYSAMCHDLLLTRPFESSNQSNKGKHHSKSQESTFYSANEDLSLDEDCPSYKNLESLHVPHFNFVKLDANSKDDNANRRQSESIMSCYKSILNEISTGNAVSNDTKYNIQDHTDNSINSDPTPIVSNEMILISSNNKQFTIGDLHDNVSQLGSGSEKIIALSMSFDELNSEMDCMGNICLSDVTNSLSNIQDDSEQQIRFLNLVTRISKLESVLIQRIKSIPFKFISAHVQLRHRRMMAKESQLKMMKHSRRDATQLNEHFQLFQANAWDTYDIRAKSKILMKQDLGALQVISTRNKIQEMKNVAYPKVYLHDTYGSPVSNAKFNRKSPRHNIGLGITEDMCHHFCHVCSQCGVYFDMISHLRHHARNH